MGKLAKLVPVELDKPRNLLLDLNAMCEFNETTGKNIFKLEGDFTPPDIRALLWASLIHEDENLTLKDVGKMVNLQNMEYISLKVMEAYTVAVPEKKEAEEENNEEAKEETEEEPKNKSLPVG